QPRGTNCGKQPADKSDGQRIKEAGCKQPRRNTKGKSHLAESLEIHRRRLIAVESEICSRSTYQATDGAEHNRFGEDRQQYRGSIETDGPQRRDFTRSGGYGRIHGEDGAEHSADTHQSGDAESECVDQSRHYFRLAPVVLVFTADCRVDLRVLHEPCAESIE